MNDCGQDVESNQFEKIHDQEEREPTIFVLKSKKPVFIGCIRINFRPGFGYSFEEGDRYVEEEQEETTKIPLNMYLEMRFDHLLFKSVARASQVGAQLSLIELKSLWRIGTLGGRWAVKVNKREREREKKKESAATAE